MITSELKNKIDRVETRSGRVDLAYPECGGEFARVIKPAPARVGGQLQKSLTQRLLQARLVSQDVEVMVNILRGVNRNAVPADAA